MPEFWLYGDEFVNDSSLNYDDRVNIKAWLAFCELARTSEAVAQVVANTRAAEVDELQDMLSYRGVTDHPDLELVRATIHGLHAAVCEASDPMSLERARQLLDDLMPPTLYSRSN